MEKTNKYGLTDQEVEIARQQYGWNELTKQGKDGFWHSFKEITTEPMFLLLVAASTLYFLTGAIQDGLFMLAALALVTAISLFQENRAKNALNALKKLTQLQSTVIRNGIQVNIPSEELVPGDCMVLEEGQLVPADGTILRANDFSVNESILTGESFQVSKSESSEDHRVSGNHHYRRPGFVPGYCNRKSDGVGQNWEKPGKHPGGTDSPSTPNQPICPANGLAGLGCLCSRLGHPLPG